MYAYQARDAALSRQSLDRVRQSLAIPKPPRPGDKADKNLTHVTKFNLETKLHLGSSDSAGTFHKYRWEVEGDYFDLGKIGIAPGRKLPVAADDVQTRYDMQLFLEATDANYDEVPPKPS